MMKEKRKGMLQRGIMVAVSALTVMASVGTVMAYEPIQSSDVSVSDSISDYDLDIKINRSLQECFLQWTYRLTVPFKHHIISS